MIAAFVLAISFYQLGIFTGFSNDRTLTDNYKNLISAMETLRSTSDYGSFTRIKFEVPAHYNMTFSADNNTITIAGKLHLENELKFDLLNVTDKKGAVDTELTLNPGNYELVIYYGNTTPSTEPYEIFFI
ncbi:MAG: hypothetical protein PHC66_03230 [Candidatus Nanoarchaeia archaeon]|nr:hypothetical protein [Candidatus Nanoarchaeia archaeon]MDD5239447.1 hypothetical protein [Candidatus Nanoarchaeia archaeon]